MAEESLSSLKYAIEVKDSALVSEYEEDVGINLMELTKNSELYSLPISNFFSVIKHFFADNELRYSIDHDLLIKNTIEIIQKFTEINQENSFLLLNFIQIPHLVLEECISILQTFTCSICSKLGQLYREDQHSVDFDWNYKVEEQEKELNDIRYKLMLKTTKPDDYEPNIFKACQKGNLASVQYLVEQMDYDIEEKDIFVSFYFTFFLYFFVFIIFRYIIYIYWVFLMEIHL